MRPLFLTLALLVLAATPAIAQPALSDSTSAVLFSINGLALNTYEGGVGYLRRLSSHTALLVGLGGEFRRTEDDFEGDQSQEDTRTFADLRLQTDVRVYVRPTARTSLYVQAGPFVGWRLDSFERMSTREGSEPFENTQEEAFLTLGGAAQLGVAYRLSGMFELSGAYVLRATYFTDLYSSGQQGEETFSRDRSGLTLSTQATRLTLAVYF
ncbi:MAG: hypothetical protein AAF809_06980 [Bacteroidota bacterium]